MSATGSYTEDEPILLSSHPVEYTCTTVLISLDANSYIFAIAKRSISTAKKTVSFSLLAGEDFKH